MQVSLCVREWIEIVSCQEKIYQFLVSLCVREWIEIQLQSLVKQADQSLPLREGVD